MTTVLVTMNRCQYAQLMQADFTPPRGCPAPDHDHSWLCGDAARQDKATGMGAKIHTGAARVGNCIGVVMKSKALLTMFLPVRRVERMQVVTLRGLHIAELRSHIGCMVLQLPY